MSAQSQSWLQVLRPKARSAAFARALAQAERLPELSDGSERALQRVVAVAQKLPQHSLDAAALYAHVATLDSWSTRAGISRALRFYRKAWVALQRSGEDFYLDSMACWNSQQFLVQCLRTVQLGDWHSTRCSRMTGTISDRESPRGLLERGVHLFSLLSRAQQLYAGNPSADAASREIHARLVSDAKRFLDELRASASGSALLGRALLSLGAALHSEDMLQAALTYIEHESPPAGNHSDMRLFGKVVALSENASVAFWRTQRPQVAASLSFDDEQCESMLTEALSRAKETEHPGFALIPLTALANFYWQVRRDPVIAEGLYRACLERAPPQRPLSGHSGTSKPGEQQQQQQQQQCPALSPASHQVLYIGALVRYAQLLAHMEWNGRRRTTESEQVAAQARQWLGPDTHVRSLETTAVSSWCVWLAEKSRRCHDVTF